MLNHIQRGTSAGKAYEVSRLPGAPTTPGLKITRSDSFVSREASAMETFEREMSAAETPEAEEAARQNLGRERTLSALESIRDDVHMQGIGCCATNRQKKRMWFIHPEGQFRKTWDFFQSFLLVYVAIMVPLRMGFSMEAEVGSGGWTVELLVDAYFIADIVFNFRTGTYDSDGVLIYDRPEIRRRYLTGWFGIDIVSCFPAGYIAQIASAVSGETDSNTAMRNMKGIRILRLLRLAKMLRLGRLKRIFARYAEELQPVMKLMKLSGMMMVALFLAHILACIWWAIGDAPDFMDDGTVVEGWIHGYGTWHTDPTYTDPACERGDDDGWSGPPNGVCSDPTATSEAACLDRDPPGIWTVFDRQDCVDVGKIPVSQAYLVSMYWSVTTLTTIGYGDISPITSLEKVVGIFSMAVGGFLFGMLVGTLSSHITAGNIAEQSYRTKIDTAREFLRMKEVPTKVRRRIMAFLDNLYAQNTAFDEEEILSQLPEHMQTELVHHMYNKITTSVPFFEHLDDDTKAAVCVKMKPVMASAQEVISSEGEVGSDLFIVVRGQVQVMRDGTTLEVQRPGAVFGDEVLFQLGGGEKGDRHMQTHVAVGSVELRCITRSDMLMLVERFPDLGQDLAKYVLGREKTKQPSSAMQNNADWLARQQQNLTKIEELATAPNATAFKAAFRSRRRSVPTLGEDDVSEFQEPTTTSPNNPTSPNKDGTKNAETVSSVADSIQVLCNEQRRAAARIDKVEHTLHRILTHFERMDEARDGSRPTEGP